MIPTHSLDHGLFVLCTREDYLWKKIKVLKILVMCSSFTTNAYTVSSKLKIYQVICQRYYMNMLAVLNFGDVVIWQLVPLHNRYTTHFGEIYFQAYLNKVLAVQPITSRPCTQNAYWNSFLSGSKFHLIHQLLDHSIFEVLELQGIGDTTKQRLLHRRLNTDWFI